MTSRLVTALVTFVAAATIACDKRVNIDNVPVGATVQLTRDDGGVVEGRLAEREADVVKLQSGNDTRLVPRDEIAVVQVLEAGRAEPLPRIAKYREYVVPNGTPIAVNLETTVDSQTSRVSDRVTATLINPVRVNGVEVLPAGSVLHGVVTSAQPARDVKGRARLAMRFSTLTAYNETYPIAAGFSMQAPSTRAKDTAKIAIPAAGGAIIGALLGGKKGAAAGAAIGGGAGTAVVLTTKGKAVVFRRGADLRLRLSAPVQVRVPV